MDQVLHIGIDDTDSMRGGCTTYIAAILVEKLFRLGSTFIDYPNLIRLNPNVPWKTRGNGAVCLRVSGIGNSGEVRETVIDVVERESDLASRGTDPGIVFYEGEKIPEDIREFSRVATQDIVRLSEALALIKKFKAYAIGFNEGRGIIGALAAVGNCLIEDHTYELIAYRVQKNRGKPRKVDSDSVFRMDNETRGLTFNNVDWDSLRILITPRGPDPILYGIRGESPEAVGSAKDIVIADEEVERWVVFRTNQGTDAHLTEMRKISEVRPFRPAVVVGAVAAKPKTIPGGHVILALEDDTGKIDCAAYEPTGGFRKVTKKLIEGDILEAYGGVRPGSSRHPVTINLEKMKIIKLASRHVYQSPLCPNCGKRMTSMGRSKGYRCDRCHYKDAKARRTSVETDRGLSLGLHMPPPRAHRHLTKPPSRYGKEKCGFQGVNYGPWHHP